MSCEISGEGGMVFVFDVEIFDEEKICLLFDCF